MMNIGTSGFRGVIGDEFTKDNVCKIMQATSDIILKLGFKKEIVFGYDNRFMAEEFVKWSCGVLCANGIKVCLTKTSVPSPLISFAGRYTKNDISLMMTSSHNPYYYNGIKIFSKDGCDMEMYIEEIYKQIMPEIKSYVSMDYDEARKQGLVVDCDYTKEYVESVINLMKFHNPITSKTLFTVMHGSSLGVVEELKKQLNLDVEILDKERDALFGLGAPIPSEANLQYLKEKAIRDKVDFAFATDGDGDRLAAFDENGNYLCGNELVSLIYYFAVKEKHEVGPFVKNYSFSTLAEKVCKFLGTEVIETPIGFKYISEQVIKHSAILGAENSGCEFRKHALTKDGLAVYCLLLEIVNYYKKPLGQIVVEMKKEIGYDMSYKEFSFKVKEKEKVKRALENGLPDFNKKIKSIGHLDGTKIFFEDGSWLLIRFSGTENLIRLVCESHTEEDMNEVISIAKKFVESV